MSSAQQSVNEQNSNFSEIQSKAFQPMRIFGGLAADTIEQVVRKNYAVMGDFVEFSIKQAQLPFSGNSAQDTFSARMQELSAFGELMNSRASEYVELASTLTENTRKASDDAAVQVREVADDVTEQTKRVADSAVVHTQEAMDDLADRAEKIVDDASDNAKKAADSVKGASDDASDKARSSASGNSKKTASKTKKSA